MNAFSCTESQMSTTTDAKKVIMNLKRLAESRLSKLALSFLLRKSGKKRTYIEYLLAMYCGEDVRESLVAYVVYPFFRYYMDRLIKEFDVDKNEFLNMLKLPYARKIIASLLKGFKIFGVRVPFSSGAPLLIVWDFTFRCNLKCKHCYASAGIELPEMSVEEKLRALDTLADSGVAMLALSGGEPILGPGFWEVLKRAHDYDMYLAMATNATLITDEIAEKLAKSGLIFAQVSLDSPSSQFHDEFRGVPGAWEKAVRGIKNLKKHNIIVEVSMTITKRNHKEIQRMLEFAKNELKVDMFMAYNYVPVGRGRDIVEWDLSPEERWEVLKILANALYNGFSAASTAPQYAAVAYEIGLEFSEKPFIAGHFYAIREQSKRFGSMLELIGGCGAGRVYLALEPNGDIYPCVFLRKKIGNILEDDFEKLWRENKVLESLRNRDLLKGECGQCQYKYVCGGCRARAYNYFGDFLAPDPGCIYARSSWEKLFCHADANSLS
ncbi:MAG: radical SAM protein [Crenarchaeota archaeon]|nr:radical SAM protein [Thermoproteota archaeon]